MSMILLDLSYQSILHHITTAEHDKRRNDRENKTLYDGDDYDNVVTLQNVIDKKKKNYFIGANTSSSSSTNYGTKKNTNNDVLFKIFEKELIRISTSILKERQNLEVNARILLNTCDETLLEKSEGKAVCEELKKSVETLYHAANDISKNTITLNQFVTRNAEYLRQLAKEADERLSTSLLFRELIQNKLASSPWTIGDGIIIIILSDIYSILRDAQQRGNNEKWVAPNSFQRKTKKYLVKEENISEVLHALVKRAPLLVYGRSGRLTPQLKKDDDNCDDAVGNSSSSSSQSSLSHSFSITTASSNHGGDYLWDKLISPVTSIYFDSQKLCMYSHRIARDEGAQLFRVRWYGAEQPRDDYHGDGKTTTTTTTTNNDTVFFELKTHWADCQSTKERVAVKYRDVEPFLSLNDGTTTTTTKDNEKKVETMDDIRQMAAAAATKKKKKNNNKKSSPSPMKEKESDDVDNSKAIDLLCELHNLVHKRGLIPCVRTTYNRVACQSSNSNDLRFTLDKDITMFDERRYFLAAAQQQSSLSSSSPKKRSSWCTTNFSNISPESIKTLPHAVLEVKIGGSDDDDVVDNVNVALVKELISNKLIEDADKFSKYVTGAAVFNNVEVMPYWASFDSLSGLFNNRRLPSKNNAPSDSISKISSSKSQSIMNSLLTTKNSFTMVRANHKSDVTALEETASIDGTLDTEMDLSLVNSNNKDNYNDSRNKFLQFFFPQSKNKSDNPIIAPRRPPRMDPKTFMANERTYINWVGTSATIFTLSQILISQGNHQGYVAGMVITSLSLLMVVYALYIYFKRLNLLQNTKEGAKFIQTFGPMFLGLALIAAISVSLLSGGADPVTNNGEPKGGGNNGDGNNNGDNGGGGMMGGIMHPIEEREGECIRKRIKGFSMLKYEPSDILVVKERNNIMLATSLESIIVLSKDEGAADIDDEEEMNVSFVLNIVGENFKGLTSINDTIYALSSSENKEAVSSSSSYSKLFACQWNDDNNGLTVINSWDIPTPGAKAITYVPDDDDGHGVGRFYIAGTIKTKSSSSGNEGGDDDRRNEISIMHAYNVPSLSLNNTDTTTMATTQHQQQQLVPYYKMNDDGFSYGLDKKDSSSSHQISSMQYFENILFLLHDSSGTIRAWDLDKGSLLAEWKINIPNVTTAVHGSNKKGVGSFFHKRLWKGMSLEWNAVTRRDRYEGLTKKSHYDHVKKFVLPSSPVHHMLRGSVNDNNGFSSSLVVVPSSKNNKELMIHLALNMPPQIWTIVIQFNDDDDDVFSTTSMIVPECSGMKNTGLSFFMD